MALAKKKVAPKKKAASKTKAATKRRRAHNEDGSFKADDPSTPNINEAFADAEMQRRLVQRSKTAGTKSSMRRLGGKLVE